MGPVRRHGASGNTLNLEMQWYDYTLQQLAL